MDERDNQRKKDKGETNQGTKFSKLAMKKIFLLFCLIDPLILIRFSFLQLYLTQYVVHASIWILIEIFYEYILMNIFHNVLQFRWYQNEF